MASALLVVGLCFELTHAANILAIFTYTSASPYLLVAPYIQALVHNGHQVTIVSSPSHLQDIDGAQHIRVKMLDKVMEGKKKSS